LCAELATSFLCGHFPLGNPCASSVRRPICLIPFAPVHQVVPLNSTNLSTTPDSSPIPYRVESEYLASPISITHPQNLLFSYGTIFLKSFPGRFFPGVWQGFSFYSMRAGFGETVSKRSNPLFLSSTVLFKHLPPFLQMTPHKKLMSPPRFTILTGFLLALAQNVAFGQFSPPSILRPLAAA